MTISGASVAELPAIAGIRDQVARALQEDVGAGDLTAALVPPDALAAASVISREAAVICGRAWFDETFRQLDERVEVEWLVDDGAAVTPDQTLCRLRGAASSLLTGERTALNFLQTLSGTATVTRRYVEALAGTRTVLLDTRKTLPGLRAAQKYAVRCGGGSNHRAGLYDAILIKENHIAAAGSIAAALARARETAPEGVKIEVEVEDLDQLREAIAEGARFLLLDNMEPATLRDAVAIAAGRAALEASGNITLETIRAVAESGVDFISVGGLTKHLRAIDLSMRFQS